MIQRPIDKQRVGIAVHRDALKRLPVPLPRSGKILAGMHFKLGGTLGADVWRIPRHRVIPGAVDFSKAGLRRVVQVAGHETVCPLSNVQVRKAVVLEVRAKGEQLPKKLNLAQHRRERVQVITKE
jgi:hypothetical protein